MRVLLDRRMDAGGVGRYAEDLSAGLASKAGVTVDLYRATGVVDRAFLPWGPALVARRARRAGADLIHGLHFEAPRASVPVVVTVPDLIPLEWPAAMSAVRRAYFVGVVRRALRQAHTVIAPSSDTASALRRRGFPLGRIEVIPHGVSPVFRPGTADDVNEARRRFAGGSRYVAVVSEDRAHKNLAVLPRIARALPAGVVLALRGPSLESVMHVPRLSLEDLRAFYVGADALLIPSHIEGFGLPALEAARCGTPVVCGPRVGAAEFLRGAVRVAEQDADSLLACLEAVVTDVGRQGKWDVADQVADLTVERMADHTYSVYEAALGR